MAQQLAEPDGLLHERFCLPMQGETEPRIERFISYRDVAGHSVPIPTVRCIECGTYRLVEPNQGRM